jgi:hypothetical protein
MVIPELPNNSNLTTPANPKKNERGHRAAVISLSAGLAAFLLIIPQVISWFISWSVAELLGKAYFIYLLVIVALAILAIIVGNSANSEKSEMSKMATTGIVLGWFAVSISTFVLAVLIIIYSALPGAGGTN